MKVHTPPPPPYLRTHRHRPPAAQNMAYPSSEASSTPLNARSAVKRRAKDSYLAALKSHILYLYDDDAMQECAAAIDVCSDHRRAQQPSTCAAAIDVCSGHRRAQRPSTCTAAIDVRSGSVRIYHEKGLLNGELFAKRNAIVLCEREADDD
ncbi:hypothetical protein M422DRAFT_250247 [Sphaerobolus stellatus SS14]|uniref:Uncharacterized protein n=1 Tax=Sphaerobolus stellatus (strain SS14) TaxID=990650 RepID=A0A0C9VGP7_SPHS4|nr:hypothetical protein M422DRAFT_250247 [Sphaerobolus stellatus SS14]